MEFLVPYLPHVAVFTLGYLLGKLWTAYRIGARMARGIKGEVFAWNGKAYVLSPVPDMPPFPGFTKQKGVPRGVGDQ